MMSTGRKDKSEGNSSPAGQDHQAWEEKDEDSSLKREQEEKGGEQEEGDGELGEEEGGQHSLRLSDIQEQLEE